MDSRRSDADFIAEKLAESGYHPDSISIDGNVIVADGDLIFYRDELELGSYKTSFDSEEVNEDVKKGYGESAGMVSRDYIQTGKLVMAPGEWRPDGAMAQIFGTAALMYSSVAGSSMSLDGANSGSQVTVFSIPSEQWPPLPGCNGSGCAEAPMLGRPGANIYMIRSDFARGCSEWSLTALQNRALHEIGHAYGFTHPKAKDSIHIDKTAECPGSPSSCETVPGYDTVMVSRLRIDTSCNTPITTLQPDDINSVSIVY
jgi:hypothetical protein